MVDRLKTPEAKAYEALQHIIGQSDFGVTYGKRHASGKNVVAFNVYRIADGKIAEHWMNTEEPVPAVTGAIQASCKLG